jgi:hypothetical protein
MARLPVGYVARTGEDIFPTTGEHLDVRVLKEGKYVDPGTIRSLLTRLKVGKDQKALWSQQGEQWKSAFPITSPFGKRTAPTAGASTQHLGQDYAIAGGTPLTWEGPGTYTPQKGYGVIKTTDVQGTPYEIRLLHTKTGQKSEVQPVPEAKETPQQRVGDTYIIMPTPKPGQAYDPYEHLSRFIGQSNMRPQFQPQQLFDPVSMLTQAATQTPNYFT